MVSILIFGTLQPPEELVFINTKHHFDYKYGRKLVLGNFKAGKPLRPCSKLQLERYAEAFRELFRMLPTPRSCTSKK